MATNSSVITALCSQLCLVDGVKPLETREWSALAEKLINIRIQPYELANFSTADFGTILDMNEFETDRIQRLLGREGSLSFEISEYENIGVKIVTRADEGYPKKLKKRLGKLCPPLFYYSGDLNILSRKAVGYVGSRSVGQEDVSFTIETVKKTMSNGYAVVSGGAKGIDSTSSGAALNYGGFAVEFLADSMIQRLRNTEVYQGIQNSRLLLMSFVKPKAGFNAGNAMARNKFIYAQSEGTVVVKSDLNKGGTWTGATENIKKSWCPLLCWNNPSYEGNQALIKNGAISIDDTWDGELLHITDKVSNEDNLITGTQISMFK